MKLFKSKKKKSAGVVALIVFTGMAKEFSAGGDINKEIVLAVHRKGNLYLSHRVSPYSDVIVNELKKNIPVIDFTEGQEVPEESMIIPSSRLISGRLELKKVVG
ncbi:MAG: hypothetical protein ACTSV7_00845 [Candidatus Baldrarchaeia archaeon]